MKKFIFSLCLLAALPLAAQKKTFTAACLNVDGLPPTVKAGGVVNVKLNPEGPQEEGTLQMSRLVAQKGWDFFGVSENFNYNTELMSEIGTYYSCGTYRGKVTDVALGDVGGFLNGKKWFDTDGLNLLWRSNISVADEAWYLWDKRNGITDAGSDQLIAKGFRYYSVRIASGLELDVYILHMDAETGEADNAAREVQMKQLVDMILASDNKRPILIMGDTNCRYTRDNLKGLLFDPINADPRFEIHDPWIDFPRKGVMPSIGDPSIMVPGKFDGTNHDAFQTGEVVDKIFYINNSDARGVTLTARNYLQDTDFTWPDGSEISDHYPIVIEFDIEKTGDELTGGEYYLRNVGNGEFLAAGANWGTRGVTASNGNRLTLVPAGDNNSFYIRTTLASLGDNLYMDASGDFPFTFNNIEGTGYYTVLSGGMALTVDGDKLIQTTAPDPSDSNQRWELITQQELTEELNHRASETNPMDATYMIRGAGFGRNDNDVKNAWALKTGNNTQLKCNFGGINENNLTESNYIGEFYNAKFISGSKTSNGTLTQNISGLPNGKYLLTFQGFTRNGNTNFYVSANGTKILFQDIASAALDEKIHDGVKQLSGKWVPNDIASAAAYFNRGLYTHSLELTVTDHRLELIINKPHTTSETWTTFDNFTLTYYGPTGEDLAALNRVKAAIDDARAKAEEAGLSSYNNRSVEDAYENRLISSDGTKEVHNTYIALAKAATRQTEIPADMRYAILNNSFELGDLTEWNVSNAVNARVENTQIAPDGSYIFKADGGRISHTPEVTMPAGIYELKASVTPGTVLSAGGRSSHPAEGEEGTMSEVSMKFVLSNGTATLEAACEGAFSADNFILTRVGDQQNAASYELLMTAIADATERVNAMGAPYNEGWDLSAYERMIDELSIEGDGYREFNEIYDMLRQRVYSQPNTDGVSYTNAIINPSFEFGNTLGWDAVFSGDTGVKENSNGTYTMQGCDGSYLFNTWNEGRGTILSQTITGLPAGHYRLRATFAADQGSYVFFEVNGQRSEAKPIERAKEIGEVKSFEFDVAANTEEVTISVCGGNSDGSYDDFGGNWYKVDKFELTRHGDTKVCFFYDRLQKAINRLNQIAADLPDKYRVQWDPSDYRDLYEKHLESDHESDPMDGSNGVAEINELYDRFRTLVFSQTESGADMSGAISNQSFELGNLSFWNINMEPVADTKVTKGNLDDTYKTEGLDGDYLLNSWLNGKSAPVSQTIPSVPAGRYRLTALVASDAGNRFFLAVNNKPGEMLETTGGGNFDTASVEFELEETTDLLIGLYPSANGEFDPDLNPVVTGPWFKTDNFRLTLLSRMAEIEWSMESNDFGTIILPFEADVPEGLEIYSLVSSAPSETKGDATAHHILEMEKKEKIAANTPYIVKRAGEASSARTASKTEEKEVYTFKGWTTHTADTYTSGLLTGTLIEAEAKETDHHLHANGDNIGFFMHDGTIEHASVEPYHAYITGITGFVPALFFSEPVLPVSWTMEGPEYGTLILPFDADVPEGLEAYVIESLSDKDYYRPTGETTQIEYQLVTLSKADAIQANTPYLVMKAGNEDAGTAGDGATLFSGRPGAKATGTLHTFKGVATNTEESYTRGLLTGTFVSATGTVGDHLLYNEGETAAFMRLRDTETVALAPNHAYIPADASVDRADLILFTAPANDDIESGIGEILADGNAEVDVYTMSGMLLKSGIKAADALRDLVPGIYVLRSGNAAVRVLKR